MKLSNKIILAIVLGCSVSGCQTQKEAEKVDKPEKDILEKDLTSQLEDYCTDNGISLVYEKYEEDEEDNNDNKYSANLYTYATNKDIDVYTVEYKIPVSMEYEYDKEWSLKSCEFETWCGINENSLFTSVLNENITWDIIKEPSIEALQSIYNETENTTDVILKKVDNEENIITQTSTTKTVGYFTFDTTYKQTWQYNEIEMKWEYYNTYLSSQKVEGSEEQLQTLINSATNQTELACGESNLTLTCVYVAEYGENKSIYQFGFLTPSAQAWVCDIIVNDQQNDSYSISQLNHVTASVSSPDDPNQQKLSFSSAGEVNAVINKRHQTGPYFTLYELEEPNYELLSENQQ